MVKTRAWEGRNPREGPDAAWAFICVVTEHSYGLDRIDHRHRVPLRSYACRSTGILIDAYAGEVLGDILHQLRSQGQPFPIDMVEVGASDHTCFPPASDAAQFSSGLTAFVVFRARVYARAPGSCRTGQSRS